MQGELTRHIFGTFINDLKEVLDGSDQAFINNFVIALNFNAFYHK